MSRPPSDDAQVPREESESPTSDTPSSSLRRVVDWLDADHVVRLVKFSLVGGLGIGVNWIFFEVGYHVFQFLGGRMAAVSAYTLGLLVSIFTNFILNDVWTWADRRKGGLRDWFYRLGKYYVSASVAGVVQVGVSSLTLAWLWAPLGWRFPGWQLGMTGLQIPAFDLGPRLGLLTGVACGMVINFLASHLWAFQDAEVE
jgi:putative flippase GtrA